MLNKNEYGGEDEITLFEFNIPSMDRVSQWQIFNCSLGQGVCHRGSNKSDRET